MPPSSPRCLSHRLATPDRTGDALRISRGRTTWSGRTESSVLLRMRPTCAAGWAPRRSKWMLPTALARRAGATSSRLGFPASTGRSSLCSSRLSMRIPGNRWCSTATAESIWWTPSPPAPATASVPFLPTASARTGTSTAAIDAVRTPTWRLDTGGCWCCHRSAAGRGCRWSGAWISQPKSTNCAQGAAGSRPSFRMQGAGDVFDANALDPSTRPAGRARRLRPRPSPCGAARRILALTPAHARAARGSGMRDGGGALVPPAEGPGLGWGRLLRRPARVCRSADLAWAATP